MQHALPCMVMTSSGASYTTVAYHSYVANYDYISLHVAYNICDIQHFGLPGAGYTSFSTERNQERKITSI